MLVAYAIPLAVLPSGLWRIAAVIFHLPLLQFSSPPPEGLEAGPWWYILLLSVVSEAAAFLARTRKGDGS